MTFSWCESFKNSIAKAPKCNLSKYLGSNNNTSIKSSAATRELTLLSEMAISSCNHDDSMRVYCSSVAVRPP